MTIELSNISCARGHRTILMGIDLRINAGQCIVLRGPNGIGKTTLLKTIAGLLPPAGGKIIIDLEHVAYAGHLDAIKAQLSVAENLAFWAGIYARRDTVEIAKYLDLTHLLNRPAQTLSAGQKRRLGLARMYLSDCKIWIMDEPTNSLDAANVALFSQLIKQHCDNHGIAVLSSHIDLGIDNVQTLDLTPYRPTSNMTNDPFLEGSFT